jgi:hypothetical protein
MKAPKTALLIALLLALPLAALATIQPGEKRLIYGKLVSLDAGARCVVVSAPLEKGPLKVGVYVPAGVPIYYRGKAEELGKLPVGHRARLGYTRQGDRLVADKLEIFLEKQ